MERVTFKPHSRHMEYPEIRIVSYASPLSWLKAGFSDLIRTWPISLGYGVVFAALGYFLVSYAWSWPHLAMVLTSGFLILAPFLALGFYDLSRQLDNNMSPKLRHTLDALNENSTSIGLYAAMLIVLLIAWERMSAILVGLFRIDSIPAVANPYIALVSSSEYWGFVVAYTLFGVVLAVVVFALSVVSLPMMLDRKVDTATAMMTSLWTVRENPFVMLFWAGIIVVLVGIGYLTAFIGLVLFFPLLGHATWRAYQDLIEPPSNKK